MKEGIYKIINGTMEKLNQEQFIIRESWRKTRDRIKRENPNVKVKYSYKTKQFTIIFDLPSDFKILKNIDINNMYETFLQNEREFEEKFPEQPDIRLNRKELRKAYKSHNHTSLIKVMKALVDELKKEMKIKPYQMNQKFLENPYQTDDCEYNQALQLAIDKIENFITKIQ